MLIRHLDTQDLPEREPTASQERAAHLRSEITILAERLDQLEPTLPRFAEAGVEELKDLRFLIHGLQQVLFDNPEYWDEEYLRQAERE